MLPSGEGCTAQPSATTSEARASPIITCSGHFHLPDETGIQDSAGSSSRALGTRLTPMVFLSSFSPSSSRATDPSSFVMVRPDLWPTSYIPVDQVLGRLGYDNSIAPVIVFVWAFRIGREQ